MSHQLQIKMTLDENSQLDIDYDNPSDMSSWEVIGILEWAKQLLIRQYEDDFLVKEDDND